MPADSLFEMSRRACGRYSARITDIGDLSYELMRSVLLKIERPEQLHQLEQNCPQLIGKDGEIWLNFIKRDIPDWQIKRHEPKDPKNWWKVYRKLKQEAQNDIFAGEDKLKAALDNIKNEKEQNLAQLMTRTDIPRQQTNKRQRIVYNYHSGRTGSKGASKMTLMEKIRKEARDSNSRMARPMHELQKRATVITKAPISFVEDVKHKASLPRTSPPKPSARQPRPPLGAPHSQNREVGDSSYDILRDREARLRALKSGNVSGSTRTLPRPTTKLNHQRDKAQDHGPGLSSDFLEDFDDDDEDETQPRGFSKNSPHRIGAIKPNAPGSSTLKRKQAPTLFMESPKKMPKRTEVT